MTVRVVAALLSALLGLTACNGDEPPATSEARLPDWIVRVYPEPGDNSASFARVQVDHHVTTEGEDVRLIVDGTDVTQYSDFGNEQTVGGPGFIAYDPADANQIVRLEPGRHRATVERVRLTDLGGESVVLDSYSWEFTIQ